MGVIFLLPEKYFFPIGEKLSLMYQTIFKALLQQILETINIIKKKMKRTFLYILAALLAMSCKNNSVQNKNEDDKPVITVTIEPLPFLR